MKNKKTEQNRTEQNTGKKIKIMSSEWNGFSIKQLEPSNRLERLMNVPVEVALKCNKPNKKANEPKNMTKKSFFFSLLKA